MSYKPVLKALGVNPSVAALRENLEAIRRWLDALYNDGAGIPVSDGAAAAAIAALEASVSAIPSAPNYAAPSAPTNLSASGLFNKILLSWDGVSYTGHSHTEVWRHTADDLGNAVKIADVFGEQSNYVDSGIPNSSLSAEYFYWVRFVNQNSPSVAGAFNSANGLSVRTGDDPAYILENLVATKWKGLSQYAVDDVVVPTIPDGKALKVVAITTGTSGGVEPSWPAVIGNQVVDSGVTWELVADDITLEALLKIALVNGVWAIALNSIFIGDATIKNAMVENLATDKLIAGSALIPSALIHELKTDKLVAGTSLIQSALIEELATDKLVAGSALIGEVLIAEAAVTTLKIGENQVTVPYAGVVGNTSNGNSAWKADNTWHDFSTPILTINGVDLFNGQTLLISFSNLTLAFSGTVETTAVATFQNFDIRIRLSVDATYKKNFLQRSYSGGSATYSNTLNYDTTIPWNIDADYVNTTIRFYLSIRGNTTLNDRWKGAINVNSNESYYLLNCQR